MRIKDIENIAKQKEYYDKRWSQNHYVNSWNLQRKQKIFDFLSLIKLNQPKILDFGCGTGWLAVELSKFGDVTAIDLSEKAIANARLKWGDVVNFICGDVFNTPLAICTYDVVISSEVIEHVERQELYIKMIADYLKPKGYLILTTPNKFVALRRLKDFKTAGIKVECQPIENLLSISQLRKMLIKRFDIIKLETIIFDVGHNGILRLINSPKLNHLFRLIRCDNFIHFLKKKFKLGLHIVVLAQKRE